jgi:hypothetical protein
MSSIPTRTSFSSTSSFIYPSGFHLIYIFPSGCKFNSSYCRQCTPAYTQRQHHKNSWRRTDYKRPFTRRTHRIWHPLTFISSAM